MLPDSLTDALLGLMLTKKEGNEAREQKNTIDGKGWSERKKRKNKYFCQFLVRSKFNKKDRQGDEKQGAEAEEEGRATTTVREKKKKHTAEAKRSDSKQKAAVMWKKKAQEV